MSFAAARTMIAQLVNEVAMWVRRDARARDLLLHPVDAVVGHECRQLVCGHPDPLCQSWDDPHKDAALPRHRCPDLLRGLACELPCAAPNRHQQVGLPVPSRATLPEPV